MAIFAIVFLAMTVGPAVLARRQPPLIAAAIGLIAGGLAVVRLSAQVKWTLLAAATVALVLPALWAKSAAKRAYLAGDQEALARHRRLGFLLTAHPQWQNIADLGAWRDMAKADWDAARPLLERVGTRSCATQPYYALVLEAAYGHLDVPALVDQRWSTSSRKLRPLLLQLAITVLVEEGRTDEALSMLGRAGPELLTATVRPLVLADIASTIGDRDTLEQILAQGNPLIDSGRAEIYRAATDWARGDTVAAHERLRSLETPPSGRTAHEVGKRLANPTPIFDESSLAGPARHGLDCYRQAAGAMHRSTSP